VVDAPVAVLVGIGQGAVGDPTVKAQVVELGRLSAQRGFDIAQTLAKGELREGHGQELIERGEGQRRIPARIAGHTPANGVQGEMIHQLSEHQPACVHEWPSSPNCQKARSSRSASSSR